MYLENARPVVSDPDEIIRIYVTVDETGNLGRRTNNEREYVVVGCVVFNRESFEQVSYDEAIRRGREVKFNTDPDLRERIIRKAAPYVEEVYYVRYWKDKALHNSYSGMPTEDKHNLHLAMLSALADAILTDYGGEIYVDIDANSLVRNYEAMRSFESSPNIGYSKVRADVQDSEYNYGLQTNDFFVGSIGQMINGPNSTAEDARVSHRYVNLFKDKLRRVYFRNNNRRK